MGFKFAPEHVGLEPVINPDRKMSANLQVLNECTPYVTVPVYSYPAVLLVHSSPILQGWHPESPRGQMHWPIETTKFALQVDGVG